MKKILEEIQTGEFTKEWATENNAGRPMLNRLRAIEAESTNRKSWSQTQEIMWTPKIIFSFLTQD